jgi:ATP-dependent DNA helicase RecQ
MDKINEILKKYWNIDSIKDKQYEIINHYMNKQDVVGLLPTGYGKSLCYLLPPLISNKAIFIISPLISLMEDQKEKLINMNIPVACLHGNNFNKDREIFKVIDGEINIIYMSPEYLIKGEGFELAKTLIENDRLGFLAIDESHCISVWGHDFRDDYLKIRRFRKFFPEIPIMAVTATATNQVVEDIIKHLELNNPKLIVANFDRPNIYLKCVGVKNINIECMEYWITKYDGHKIIIYTNSREQTSLLSKEINNKYGAISNYYHAGMSKGLRNKVQTKFNNGDINIIVSTVAFGMGIDQTVRCVLIFGSPNSIEEYYQMIGRAGRDGKEAESVLFFQYKSVAIGTSMIKKGGFDKEVENSKVKGLNKMANYFYYPGCRRRFILEHFNQVPKFFLCNYCDNCCEKDLTDYTDKFIKVLFNIKGNTTKSREASSNYKYNEVFTQKELEMLGEKPNDTKNKDDYHSLLRITNTNNIEPLLTIKNWKKIIEANKYLETKIPKKYLIKL